MRTIKNQKIRTASHSDTFSDGVASIVRDKAINPTNYRDYELDAITRKEMSGGTATPGTLLSNGFHLADLLQVLSWGPRSNQAQS